MQPLSAASDFAAPLTEEAVTSALVQAGKIHGKRSDEGSSEGVVSSNSISSVTSLARVRGAFLDRVGSLRLKLRRLANGCEFDGDAVIVDADACQDHMLRATHDFEDGFRAAVSSSTSAADNPRNIRQTLMDEHFRSLEGSYVLLREIERFDHDGKQRVTFNCRWAARSEITE